MLQIASLAIAVLEAISSIMLVAQSLAAGALTLGSGVLLGLASMLPPAWYFASRLCPSTNPPDPVSILDQAWRQS